MLSKHTTSRTQSFIRKVGRFLTVFAVLVLMAPLPQATAAAAETQALELGEFLELLARGDSSALSTNASVLATDQGLKFIMPPEPCNGGSCESGNGNVLNCPVSGGPTCSGTQSCVCVCARNSNGSWGSANTCQTGS